MLRLATRKKYYCTNLVVGLHATGNGLRRHLSSRYAMTFKFVSKVFKVLIILLGLVLQ
jgi:hypothetical protein